jgi:hypothetical protein
MVREPFPSVTTGTTMDFGSLAAGESLTLTSEMPENGVVFADGIETDTLEFLSDQTVTVSIANEALNLILPAGLRGAGPLLQATETGVKTKGRTRETVNR